MKSVIAIFLGLASVNAVGIEKAPYLEGVVMSLDEEVKDQIDDDKQPEEMQELVDLFDAFNGESPFTNLKGKAKDLDDDEGEKFKGDKEVEGKKVDPKPVPERLALANARSKTLYSGSYRQINALHDNPHSFISRHGTNEW